VPSRCDREVASSHRCGPDRGSPLPPPRTLSGWSFDLIDPHEWLAPTVGSPGFAISVSFEVDSDRSQKIRARFRPCCSPSCPSADQTEICAIAQVLKQSTSGCYSTDESVVSIPVARYRHPILPWALVPFEVRRHRRRSDSALHRSAPLCRSDHPLLGSASLDESSLAAVQVCPVVLFSAEADDPRGVFNVKDQFD
jgi:hypothetical protein